MHASTLRLCAGLLLAFSAIVGAAQAQDITPRCPVPASSTLFKLMHNAPDAVVFELRGKEAKTAIEIFNSLPPLGRESGDRFYIAFRPGFPYSRLLVASHGCIENAAVVDVRVAIAIRSAVKRVVDAGVSL